MGMSFQLEVEVLTNGEEKRVGENQFCLIKKGYHLYPLDVPIVVKRSHEDVPIGEGIIERLELGEKKTTIHYRLLKLNTTN